MKHLWLKNNVVILVTYDGSPWLDEALTYLEDCKYPILLCVNTLDDNAYDPAGFYIAQELSLKSFILLHDSCFVKDISILDILFSKPGNIAMSPNYLMCMGKFENVPDLPPKPTTKVEAVNFETNLRNWPCDGIQFQDFIDTHQVFEEKNGRNNMILENQYFKKYKGSWDLSMC